MTKLFLNDLGHVVSVVLVSVASFLGWIGGSFRMEKHILILATTHDFLWKFEREDVNLLQQMGFVVHYATNIKEPIYVSYKKDIQRMGVQIHHIEIARSPFLLRDNCKALQQLLQLIDRYSIQAIHCHTPVGGLLGRLAGRLCRNLSPLILYTAHGFHFYRGAPLFNRLVYYQVEKKLANDTDVLIVINGEDFKAAQKFHLKPGGRLYQIPGVGLDQNVFHPLPDQRRNVLRDQLGIGNHDFFLLSVGELNENKNHRVVLEALAEMKRQHKDLSHIRYGICGDGFLHERIQQWIQEWGLEKQVILFGYRTQVSEILGCADASVLSSKREGLGMAGLESLAMGVPVLAADNRGTREYMVHGQNGFVCERNEAAAFIEGIEFFLRLGPEERAMIRDRCCESAKPFAKAYTNAIMQEIYAEVNRRIEQRMYKPSYKNQHHHGGI